MTLNAVYAARGYTPLWTGGREAQARLNALLALLGMESAADTAAAANSIAELDGAGPVSDVTLEVNATRAAIAYLVRRSGAATVATAKVLKAFQRLDQATPSGPLATALLELELVQDLGGWWRVGTVPGPLPTVPPAAVASPEVDVAPALPRGRRCLSPPRCGSGWRSPPTCRRASCGRPGDGRWADRGGAAVPDSPRAAVGRCRGRATLAALNAPVARADRASAPEHGPRHAGSVRPRRAMSRSTCRASSCGWSTMARSSCARGSSSATRTTGRRSSTTASATSRSTRPGTCRTASCRSCSRRRRAGPAISPRAASAWRGSSEPGPRRRWCRSRARRMRSAGSSSCSPTTTPSTCTTRRSAGCSAAASAA